MIPALAVTFPQASLRQLFLLLGLSRSGIYAARQRPAPATAVEALALGEAFEGIVQAFPGYGYRRVTHQLRREGWRVNAKRVLRVMHEEALLCHGKRRFVATTDARHGFTGYPNLLRERAVRGRDEAWIAYITYIRCRPPSVTWERYWLPGRAVSSAGSSRCASIPT
jgi:hypothetical protein